MSFTRRRGNCSQSGTPSQSSTPLVGRSPHHVSKGACPGSLRASKRLACATLCWRLRRPRSAAILAAGSHGFQPRVSRTVQDAPVTPRRPVPPPQISSSRGNEAPTKIKFTTPPLHRPGGVFFCSGPRVVPTRSAWPARPALKNPGR